MKTLLRILIAPLTLLLLAGTAIIEALSRKPDWGYWCRYNRELIEMLPL